VYPPEDLSLTFQWNNAGYYDITQGVTTGWGTVTAMPDSSSIGGFATAIGLVPYGVLTGRQLHGSLALELNAGQTVSVEITAASGISQALTAVATNITLIQLIASGPSIQNFTYEIGEAVPSEGGVIAHRWWSTTSGGKPESGTVQNYLIVDDTELSTAQWASLDAVISGADSTWDGANNTANLIIAGPVDGITTGVAAELCDSSTNNGFTDWILPSIDHLVKMYTNRWEIAQGLEGIIGSQILATKPHWSSTQYDLKGAYTLNFLSGGSAATTKSTSTSVRAVRTFSIP
jgi:hypothetical protein